MNDKPKLTHPRDEIRKRTGGSLVLDPAQSALESEAKKIEARLTAGIQPQEEPTAADMAEQEYKARIVTPNGTPVATTPEQLELEAKASLEKAAAMRRIQAEKTVKNPLTPGQEPLIDLAMRAFVFFSQQGLDPDAATAMTEAYSRLELAVAVKSALLRR